MATSTQNVQDAFAIYFFILVASFCATIYSNPKEKLLLKL